MTTEESEKTRMCIDYLTSLGYKVVEPQNKKTMQERKQIFCSKCMEYQEKYGISMIQEFFNFWSEANENGKKMRFEMQKTFAIPNRLATWSRNDKKWNRRGGNVEVGVLNENKDERKYNDYNW